MRIGELGRAVNCSVETIRYYEKAGLLPPSDRADNGYRTYNEMHLKLLRLIRRTRALGFSQAQVREFVALATSQESPCNEVWDLTKSQLNIINEKQKELRRVSRALKKLGNACEQNNHASCPVLDELISGH